MSISGMGGTSIPDIPMNLLRQINGVKVCLSKCPKFLDNREKGGLYVWGWLLVGNMVPVA
jgi:hypothetical protein